MRKYCISVVKHFLKSLFYTFWEENLQHYSNHRLKNEAILCQKYERKQQNGKSDCSVYANTACSLPIEPARNLI